MSTEGLDRETEERADAVAERVAAIIAAAEETAAAIRSEAEEVLATRRAEADREAARIVADARRQADEAKRALAGHAKDLLARLDEVEKLKAGVEEVLRDLGGAPERPGKALDTAEEARLLALQMAMAGRTRGEAAADLRHGMRLEDPEPILDDVFGKGTPDDQRIPWSVVSKGDSP